MGRTPSLGSSDGFAEAFWRTRNSFRDSVARPNAHTRSQASANANISSRASEPEPQQSSGSTRSTSTAAPSEVGLVPRRAYKATAVPRPTPLEAFEQGLRLDIAGGRPVVRNAATTVQDARPAERRGGGHEHPGGRRRTIPPADHPDRPGEHGPPGRRGRPRRPQAVHQVRRGPGRTSCCSTCGSAGSPGSTCWPPCTGGAGLGVVVITAHASIDTAVEAMRRGALDYLPKPFTPAQLADVLARWGGRGRRRRRRGRARHRASRPCGRCWTWRSPSPASDATVLLRGESGTGKGVLARAVHARSRRGAAGRSSPSTARACRPSCWRATCSATPKGRSPGPSGTTDGKVAAADGGTLFLDEVGDLPLPLQPKLLRLVQDRTYERVGRGRRRGRPTCGSWRRPTATWRRRWRPAGSARTCSTGST